MLNEHTLTTNTFQTNPGSFYISYGTGMSYLDQIWVGELLCGTKEIHMSNRSQILPLRFKILRKIKDNGHVMYLLY